MKALTLILLLTSAFVAVVGPVVAWLAIDRYPVCAFLLAWASGFSLASIPASLSTARYFASND